LIHRPLLCGDAHPFRVIDRYWDVAAPYFLRSATFRSTFTQDQVRCEILALLLACCGRRGGGRLCLRLDARWPWATVITARLTRRDSRASRTTRTLKQPGPTLRPPAQDHETSRLE
jgi:hypothetical protein